MSNSDDPLEIDSLITVVNNLLEELSIQIDMFHEEDDYHKLRETIPVMQSAFRVLNARAIPLPETAMHVIGKYAKTLL